MLLLVTTRPPQGLWTGSSSAWKVPPRHPCRLSPPQPGVPALGPGLSHWLCARCFFSHSSVRRHLPVSPPLLPPGIRALSRDWPPSPRAGWGGQCHTGLWGHVPMLLLYHVRPNPDSCFVLGKGVEACVLGLTCFPREVLSHPSEMLRVCGLLTGTWGEGWQPAYTCACLTCCPEAWPVGNRSGPAARAFSAAPLCQERWAHVLSEPG